MAKTHSSHSQRLTAVMASEKVTSSLPGHCTARSRADRLGNCWYKQATTVDTPFWYLQKNGFWVIDQPDILPRVKGKDRAKRAGLITWADVAFAARTLKSFRKQAGL
jgi:hypothetical protein